MDKYIRAREQERQKGVRVISAEMGNSTHYRLEQETMDERQIRDSVG